VSDPIFYLHIRTRGCAADIRLNDAPCFSVRVDAPQAAFPTISEWVVVGENVLSVELTELGEDPRVHVALCEAQIGDVPEPGHERELIVIDWPPLPTATQAPARAPTAPLILRATGQATHPFGEWSWQHAPPLTLDRRTITDVIAYVRDLHAALAAGQIDALIDQSAVKFNEVAPAYAMSVSEARQRITDSWAALSAQPGWQLAPFDEADIDLRLHCDARLIEPTTREGLPVIRQAQAIDGELWAIELFIAGTHWEYTAGQLTIVR
jgi:hypothetical protein